MGFDLLGWLLGWALGGLASAREPAREPERAGSARLGVLASREKRLGSARSKLASRSEPSRAAPSPSRASSRELFLQPYLGPFLGHVYSKY
jgi:hypothetical protein